jgi:hypothetical protein
MIFSFALLRASAQGKSHATYQPALFEKSGEAKSGKSMDSPILTFTGLRLNIHRLLSVSP